MTSNSKTILSDRPAIRRITGQLLMSASLILMLLILNSCGGSKQVSTEDGGAPGSARISELEKQARKNPDDIVLQKQLYREYLNLNMIPQAISTMESIIAADPYQTEVQFEYAELQYKSGNTRTAYKAFLSILQSGTGDVYKTQIASYVSGSYLVQRITSSAADEGFPVFSPEGDKLTFQKKNGDNWDIVEFHLDSKTETVLADSPADEENPVYAPNGEQLVFTSTFADRRPIASSYKAREIAQMQMRDKYVAYLTQSVADDWLPRYSHDGNYLLFVSERDDLRKVNYVSKQSDIYIMESDGDFQQRLTDTEANEGGACFSADDSKIYFHSNKNGGQYDIFVMKRDGSKVMTVVDNEGADDINPSVSRDGLWITFVSDRDGNYEIYRAALDGSSQERLTFHPGTDASPSFSPDGNMITFHSNRSGNYDVYLINLGYSTSSMTTNDLIQRLTEMSQ